MPLFAFNYCAAGCIETDPETGILKHDVLPTEGEMTDSDFLPPPDFEYCRLKPVFVRRRMFQQDDDSINNYKHALSSFLSEHTQGPYYVHDDALDGESVLSIVLLDTADITAFRSTYDDWQFLKDNVKINYETITQWRLNGKPLDNKSIYSYASAKPD